MRIALVCDWLTVYSGAERVVEQMLKVLPEADIFSLVDFLPEDQRHFLMGKPVKTSFVQRLPLAKRRFRGYLPLFPFAIEQFDFSDYDLVVSSSHAVAKGVITGPDTRHICMCYTPIRYAWDMEGAYLRERGLTTGLRATVVRYMLHRLRQWDYISASRVDDYIAISRFIAKRIRKFYGRDSAIIYPPVAIDSFPVVERKEEFYLTASRQVPYKRIPLIVEAFRRLPHRKLVVIGDGPEAAKVAEAAKGAANIEVRGFQSGAVLRDYMQRAKAFVFAAKEDFGIVLVEAQSCGTPVIAFNGGGALDIVHPLGHATPTGLLFEEQTVESIREAVEAFERNASEFSPAACRRNAERFSEDRFRREFRQMVFGIDSADQQNAA